MRDLKALQRALHELDGQGYGGYKRLKGRYDLGDFRLSVDHVQVDPYAPPSKIRILCPRGWIQLPRSTADTPDQRIASADHLGRLFHAAVTSPAHSDGDRPRANPRGRWGQGAGGDDQQAIRAYRSGQEVLERSTVVIGPDTVEVRLEVALPAAGRRIRGDSAARILTQVLPAAVVTALAPQTRDDDALVAAVELYQDQEALRGMLKDRGLVAFVGDGAVLPRRSGDSDLPLRDGAVPFDSPESLRTSFVLPSGRTVTGMGVPTGITVIVGGGYHGKSTLLAALTGGVYPHVAGDGREWVITRADAVSIRAEDGRAVTRVDISAFITGLPTGVDTREFTTTNASGSTSQAANLVEALEAGASTVLIDEDTSATNFMIRDERMKRLVPAHREPITPFVERVKPLLEQTGVSTILVAGGSGAFFDVADQVIAMDSYRPHDVTSAAREIAASTPWADEADDAQHPRRQVAPFRARTPRIIDLASLCSPGGKSPRARGQREIQVGKDSVDLAAVAQLVDAGQTQAVALALEALAHAASQGAPGRQALQLVARDLLARVHRDGLDSLSPHEGHPGYLAMHRQQELQAAVNRLRQLRVVNGH